MIDLSHNYQGFTTVTVDGELFVIENDLMGDLSLCDRLTREGDEILGWCGDDLLSRGPIRGRLIK